MSNSSNAPIRGGTRLRVQIPFFIAVRVVLNTMYRMVYPFLPVFARGIGVDIRTMSSAISIRAAAGTLGPLIAPLSDRRGRRFGMTLGIGLFAAGASIPFLGKGMAFLTAALVLATIGKYVFDPAMQAHLGDRIPYGSRGTAIAFTEWGWSLAFILGVPAAGFLIVRFGWRSPFLVLAILAVAALFAVQFIVPGPRDGTAPGERSPSPAHPRESGRHFREVFNVFRSAPAVAALAVVFLGSFSNEAVNVVLGVWLEDSFGLKIAGLGAASALIGFSEMGAETLAAATIDRIGKIKAILIGLGLNALIVALLPFSVSSPATALAALFALYLTFEYAAVSLIPVISEIQPDRRATLLAFYTAAFSLGRAIGSWISPRLYGLGFQAVAVMAFAGAGLACLTVIWLGRLMSRKK